MITQETALPLPWEGIRGKLDALIVLRTRTGLAGRPIRLEVQLGEFTKLFLCPEDEANGRIRLEDDAGGFVRDILPLFHILIAEPPSERAGEPVAYYARITPVPLELLPGGIATG